MEQLVFTSGLLAVLVLGLSAGALLAEAGVLVPSWRAQTPEAFLDWYRDNAGRLLRFFGPLEAASGFLVVVATAMVWLGQHPSRWLFLASTVLTLAVLATFPLYFQGANASFAAGTIAKPDLASELRRWATWHWGRTILAILAFLLALLAFLRGTCVPAV